MHLRTLGLHIVDPNELHIEHEVGVGGNDTTRSPTSICHLAGDVQHGPLTQGHLGNAHIPALDNQPRPEDKRKGPEIRPSRSEVFENLIAPVPDR